MSWVDATKMASGLNNQPRIAIKRWLCGTKNQTQVTTKKERKEKKIYFTKTINAYNKKKKDAGRHEKGDEKKVKKNLAVDHDKTWLRTAKNDESCHEKRTKREKKQNKSKILSHRSTKMSRKSAPTPSATTGKIPHNKLDHRTNLDYNDETRNRKKLILKLLTSARSDTELPLQKDTVYPQKNDQWLRLQRIKLAQS